MQSCIAAWLFEQFCILFHSRLLSIVNGEFEINALIWRLLQEEEIDAKNFNLHS